MPSTETPDQQGGIETLAQHWIGLALSTHPAGRDEAESSVASGERALGLETATACLLFQSPLPALVAVAIWTHAWYEVEGVLPACAWAGLSATGAFQEAGRAWRRAWLDDRLVDFLVDHVTSALVPDALIRRIHHRLRPVALRTGYATEPSDAFIATYRERYQRFIGVAPCPGSERVPECLARICAHQFDARAHLGDVGAPGLNEGLEIHDGAWGSSSPGWWTCTGDAGPTRLMDRSVILARLEAQSHPTDVARMLSREVRHAVERVWAPVDSVASKILGDLGIAASAGVARGFGPIQSDSFGLADWIVRTDALEGTGGWSDVIGVAAACGWWWPLRGLTILTERPVSILRDSQGRLHADRGPAIQYRDGWSLHAWHGVAVPRHVAERPHRITIEQVDDEADPDVRRVLVERYGIVRYLVDSGATEIQRDRFGALYRQDAARPVAGDHPPDRTPRMFVHVRNATQEADGTQRDYLLRVPPDVTSAHEAVAWTFGKIAEDYDPIVET